MKFQFQNFGFSYGHRHCYSPLFFLVFFLLFACQSNQKEKLTNEIAATDTAKFYPIEKFIQEEIQYVDLRNFIITETNTYENGDSVNTKKVNTTKQLSKDEFLSAVREIRNVTTDFSKNKNLFKETIFQDLGTESYTINYQSEKSDIKNIDLLLNVQTNLPKRLFIREMTREEENIITVQYSWIVGKQFTIAKSMKNGRTLIWQSSKTIQWNNKP